MSRVIQFMHPGGQPSHLGPGPKPWNTGNHCRSFLKASGAYCESLDGRPTASAALLFWGEWEAPAAVHRLESTLAQGLYVPRPPQFPGGAGLQNTDPFVFDGPFLYSCCKQVRKDGTVTYLRELDRGDVILFGSHVAGSFVMDTVFVVRLSTLYNAARGPMDLAGQIAPSFVEATLKPLAHNLRDPSTEETARKVLPCPPDMWTEDDEVSSCGVPQRPRSIEFRLYEGATPENPVDGMFSFVPAAQASDKLTAFARPNLDSLEFVETGMTAGFRDCRVAQSSGVSVHRAWEAVATLTIENGLLLGTKFQLAETSSAA
ncbi:MAG: hypothetical protein MAG451_01153 [Anaerolineales bacterium]|nr:hypothetical protein [Anaerolineales bacterium]